MIFYYSLIAACAAFTTVEVFKPHKIIGWDFKPFNCGVCLSGWYGLIIAGLNGMQAHSIEALFIAPVLNIIISLLLNNLFEKP